VPGTFGYHPLSTDLPELVRGTRFDELLVLGPSVPDVVDGVGTIKCLVDPAQRLPSGIYWFSGIHPSAAMVVQRGLPEGGGMTARPGEATEDSALGQALVWFEHFWSEAVTVPTPTFQIAQDVLVKATGHDGSVKVRAYSHGRWTYIVFAGGKTQRFHELVDVEVALSLLSQKAPRDYEGWEAWNDPRGKPLRWLRQRRERLYVSTESWPADDPRLRTAEFPSSTGDEEWRSELIDQSVAGYQQHCGTGRL
jgi:hypothetical protein